MLSDVT
ncbi:hypothetical protein PENSTE_c031G09026 [Penicillium steckii]|nr:hypothetical protein PENSTE_c031G09026 [Penicillium steckii]